MKVSDFDLDTPVHVRGGEVKRLGDLTSDDLRAIGRALEASRQGALGRTYHQGVYSFMLNGRYETMGEFSAAVEAGEAKLVPFFDPRKALRQRG